MKSPRFLLYALALVALAFAPEYLPAYYLSLLGRFLALSILAIGLTMVWGHGGILSLGQGVFFGIGGYCIAMHLKLSAMAAGDLPDFMQWSGLSELPWWWAPFRSPVVAIAAMLALPALAAAGLAWLVFHRRVGGVYFALITQALALALSTFVISQQAYTGGFNGLTDFTSFLGFAPGDPQTQRGLYWVTLGTLAAAFGLCAWLLRSNFGKLLAAVREGENRVRFLGYNPTPVKVAVFALGALLAGVAGGLFTLHAGVISPALIGVVPSIEMIIWVAVGGRSSLAGAILGTLIVNFGKDWISSAAPDLWLIAMGAMFILVVTALPDGLTGLTAKVRRAIAKRPRVRFQRALTQPVSIEPALTPTEASDAP